MISRTISPGSTELMEYIKTLTVENKLANFYHRKEWKSLRAAVLRDAHYECVDCKARNKIRKAVTVHHVNEVKHRPELALSRYYTDKDGIIKENLIPLCHECHDARHERMQFKHSDNEKKFTTPERW